VALVVEVVVDGRMDGGEFLERPHASEPKHSAFSSSERLVGVFGPVVDPPAVVLVQMGGSNGPERRRIGSRAVGDDAAGATISPHQLPQELESRPPIALLCNDDSKDFSFVVDRTPQIVGDAVDLYEDLIEVPSPFGTAPTEGDPSLLDLSREYRSESVLPKPHGLVADIDAALGEQVLDIA
jgi:hypothetical protein